MHWQNKIPTMIFSFSLFLPFGFFHESGAETGELTKDGDYQLSASCQPTPRLIQFEQRLEAIQHQIDVLIEDYKNGKMTKIAAETKARALLAEEMAIKHDPAYDIERSMQNIFCISQ